MSCTGKGTICNMVLKLVQPLLHLDDDSMGRYLRSTDRSDVADAADKVAEYLTGDEEVYANPELYFDQVIEINLSELSRI
jgi:aconitate hydratase